MYEIYYQVEGGMLRSRRYRCFHCGLIIESEQSPAPETGGRCPKSYNGAHSWVPA